MMQSMLFYKPGQTIQQETLASECAKKAECLINATVMKFPSAKIVISGTLPRCIPVSLSNEPNGVSIDLNDKLRQKCRNIQRLTYLDQATCYNYNRKLTHSHRILLGQHPLEQSWCWQICHEHQKYIQLYVTHYPVHSSACNFSNISINSVINIENCADNQTDQFVKCNSSEECTNKNSIM